MTACKWTSRETPRVIPGRHTEDCADRYGDDEHGCAGCLPCTEDHCRVCGVGHVAGTCAECLAETREALREIARMVGSLPEEVEHRGVEGEAMMLLAPAANPEARGHLEASVLAGRVSREAIEATHLRGCTNPKCVGCAGELHQDLVLGSWEDVWREALDHDPPNETFDLGSTVDYLDRTMSYMGSWPHVPFDDFARDLRRCRSHLEAVLHDGEQVDRGVPCMTCGATLIRTWGNVEAQDGWKCPRCKRTSTEVQYRFAVAHLHREEATHLTDREMELRTGIKAGTVRVWANRGDVDRLRDQGRTVYSVVDVQRVAKARGKVS